MVRELVENAIGLVREQEMANVEDEAKQRTEDRLVRMLLPEPPSFDASPDSPDSSERYERNREKIRAMLIAGEMEERKVEITTEQKAPPMMMAGFGPGEMDIDLQGMFEKILPKSTSRTEMTVAEARKVIFEQECENLLNPRRSTRRQSSWPRTPA